MPVAHVLGKLGAADSTEAGTDPGSWALIPDTAPSRLGNTFG